LQRGTLQQRSRRRTVILLLGRDARIVVGSWTSSSDGSSAWHIIASRLALVVAWLLAWLLFLLILFLLLLLRVHV
jgi:Flp pilus assembly protein TadB